MNDLIFRIKNSAPSLVGDTARELAAQFMIQPDYVWFHSNVTGLDTISQLAEVFITSLATVKSDTGKELLSFQPVHVLEFSLGLPKSKAKHKALMYSNGLILYTYDESIVDSQELILLMSKQVCEANGLNETVKIIVEKDTHDGKTGK